MTIEDRKTELDLQARPPVARTATDVRKKIADARARGQTIGLVPTMGALHAGHLSLIEHARRRDAFIVVSIYVNPTQFAPHEDLSSYPRPFADDHRQCADAGVDLVFAPTDEIMYPPGDETRVQPGALAIGLCGPHRPGHFEGVCTVVARLFNLVAPDFACFGQKDAQQALIIKRMVTDLQYPIEIVECPTLREPDGLALSSRNAYLSNEERMRALCLYRALSAGRESLLKGDAAERAATIMHETIAQSSPPDAIDYLVAVEATNLQAVTEATRRVLLAGAIRIGKTRLIDNLLVDLPPLRT